MSNMSNTIELLKQINVIGRPQIHHVVAVVYYVQLHESKTNYG